MTPTDPPQVAAAAAKKPQGLQATRVEANLALEADRGKAPAGGYTFTGRLNHEGIHGLLYVCPCGCGSLGSLHFEIGDDAQKPSWKWDGNEAAPTLTPSIRRLPPGCEWHGWLRQGVWVTA